MKIRNPELRNSGLAAVLVLFSLAHCYGQSPQGSTVVVGSVEAALASSFRPMTGNGVPAAALCNTAVGITSSTNATPIVITKTAHGFLNGDVITIYGHTTNTAANGTWMVANKTANTYELAGYWDGTTNQNPAVGNGVGGATGFASKQVGRLYFRTDATAGQNLYYCTDSSGSPTWSQQLNSGSGGAAASLNNLAAVSINTSLLPQTGVDAGSAGNAFREMYIWGTGTYGTTSIKLTGVPTSNRVVTFPDTNSNTVVPSSAGANTYATGISAGGVVAYSAVASSNLSDGTNLPKLNTGNTWTSGTQDFTGVTALKLPVAAGATASADGAAIYDSTNKNTHLRANAADGIAGVFASAPSTGDVVSATVASGNVLLSDAGFLAANVVQNTSGGQSGTLPKFSTLKIITNSDISNSTANTLNAVTTTQALTYTGGQDASGNAALGGGTFRGADETGAGGASSQGGGTFLRAGNNAATNTASTAGTLQISAGQSTGASSTGLQGLLIQTESYAKGTTVTQWSLQCSQTTAMQTQDCASLAANIIGVAEAVGSIAVNVATAPSQIPINARAAVTLGHTVCVSTTPGQIIDSGGTAACTTGVTVGTVIATSGTWPAYPDGTAFPTLSTTLPLIQTAFIPGAAGGVTALAGQGRWLWGPGYQDTTGRPAGGAGPLKGSVFRFSVEGQLRFDKLNVSVTATGGAGSGFRAAIYSADRTTRRCDLGAVSGNSAAGTVLTLAVTGSDPDVSGGVCILPAGGYSYVQVSDVTGLALAGILDANNGVAAKMMGTDSAAMAADFGAVTASGSGTSIVWTGTDLSAVTVAAIGATNRVPPLVYVHNGN